MKGAGTNLMDLRSILEWDIAPVMRTVPGVTDINTHGGFAKSYEVQVDPDRMSSHGISLGEVLEALERNNASTGGGYIVKNGEQRFIRGEALLAVVDDIEKVIVRSPAGGVPVLIRNIGSGDRSRRSCGRGRPPATAAARWLPAW